MLSALRAGPAALVLLLALPLARSRLPSREQWLWAGVTGLLMVTYATEALPEAVTRAGAGNTAVLVNVSPLFVALAGVLLLREWLSPTAAVGLLVGFGGVVVMTAPQLGGSSGTGDLALGIGLALGVSVFWAVGILIIKAVTQRDPQLDMLGFTAAQYAVGAPILVIAAFAAEGVGGTDWQATNLWGSLAWLAVGTSALASLAFFSALKRVSAERAAAWQFVAPVIAVLVEVARGASPGVLVLVGMVLAIAGVAIVTSTPQQTESPRHGLRGGRSAAEARPGVPGSGPSQGGPEQAILSDSRGGRRSTERRRASRHRKPFAAAIRRRRIEI